MTTNNMDLDALKSLASTQDPETSAASTSELTPATGKLVNGNKVLTMPSRSNVKQLSLKVDDPLYAKLRKCALKHKLSHQDIGYTALKEWLERNA